MMIISIKLSKSFAYTGTYISRVIFSEYYISMSKAANKLSVEVDEIRKEFCHNMVKNIEDRFPKEAVDGAMAFHILGMRTSTINQRRSSCIISQR